MKSALQIAFLALVLGALGQAFWQHAHLPDRVATHFNGAGVANGWLSRGAHTACQVGTVLFMAAMIQGIVLLQARLPKDFINLPHRDHWLAPERAAATREWIAGAVLLIGCALQLFFIGLFRLVYQANLAPAPRLDSAVWVYAGLLLLVVAGFIVALTLRFRRPAGA